jgi:hypothetical protein
MSRRYALVAVAALLFGCGGPGAKEARGSSASLPGHGLPLRYAFVGIDGRRVSSEEYAKRVTVLAFLTTYDVPSQVEARFLASLLRHHTPRLNVAALMLENEDNRPLVDAFAVTLGLPYPIALVDASTIEGQGTFAGLHHVPSVVILDRDGREAYRHVGFIDEATLEAAVRAVERAQPQ